MTFCRESAAVNEPSVCEELLWVNLASWTRVRMAEKAWLVLNSLSQAVWKKVWKKFTFFYLHQLACFVLREYILQRQT